MVAELSPCCKAPLTYEIYWEAAASRCLCSACGAVITEEPCALDEMIADYTAEDPTFPQQVRDATETKGSSDG